MRIMLILNCAGCIYFRRMDDTCFQQDWPERIIKRACNDKRQYRIHKSCRSTPLSQNSCNLLRLPQYILIIEKTGKRISDHIERKSCG